jgi:sigma-B regulation protein RsbU (phosphoserine phosphatase)
VVYGAGDGGGEVDVRAIAVANPSLAREVRISTTAARQVIADKVSLMITDAFADDRFRAQQSILDSKITSILCAPLWHAASVFGLLYLDTTDRLGAFGKEQLALLSAFANLAAIKIDNLRLVAESIARARMERELALAAEIQAAMLPPPGPFPFPGFASVGFNRACYEVGGDYFDFMPIDDETFAVTVADVSGKGASAALLMASVKSMLTALVDTGAPLLERVVRLNSYIKENSTANKFVTLFHAEFDGRAGTLRFCNGGHNPPIVVAADGATSLLETTGPVLGLLELPYEEREVPFEPGSVLVSFSDGVTEAVAADDEDEEYGDERLAELVAGLCGRSPEAVLEAILEDVQRFAGGFPDHDDVTVLIVKRDG